MYIIIYIFFVNKYVNIHNVFVFLKIFFGKKFILIVTSNLFVRALKLPQMSTLEYSTMWVGFWPYPQI